MSAASSWPQLASPGGVALKTVKSKAVNVAATVGPISSSRVFARCLNRSLLHRVKDNTMAEILGARFCPLGRKNKVQMLGGGRRSVRPLFSLSCFSLLLFQEAAEAIVYGESRNVGQLRVFRPEGNDIACGR